MANQLSLLVLFSFALLPVSSLSGDILNPSFSVEAIADFKGSIDTQNSTSPGSQVLSIVSVDNSISEARLAWNWDGTSLTQLEGQLRAEKTVSAGPGGNHSNAYSFQFQFTIDEPMEYEFVGSWGVSDVQSADESMQWTLSGPAGVVDSANFVASVGTSTTPINSSGTLASLGTYSFQFSGSLTERINSRSLRTAQFNFSNFRFFKTVPEPNSLLPLIGLLLGTIFTRKRKNN